MIQAEGRIEVPSIAASRAIQEKLFAMGYGWSRLKIRCVKEEAKSYPIGWIGGNITYASMGIEDLFFCGPIHTLADFNLDEDGNELATGLTLKDIEIGCKYRLRLKNKIGNTPEYAKWDGEVVTIESKSSYDVTCKENHFMYRPSELVRIERPNAQSETPKPFKDGDRVVLNESAKTAIRLGYIDFSDDPTGVLTVKPLAGEDHFQVVGAKDWLRVNTDGSVRGCEGHILHAPTFGNLKAGDPNPFVVGMPVTDGERVGKVATTSDGPSVCVNWPTHTRWSGFHYEGVVIGNAVSINDIFPAPEPVQPETLETPKPTHSYKYGDKVSRHNEEYYFLTENNGLSFVVPDSDWGFAQTGSEFLTESFPSEELTPWPTSETLDIQDLNGGVISVGVDVGMVSIGRRKISIEDFNKMAEAVAKICKA